MNIRKSLLMAGVVAAGFVFSSCGKVSECADLDGTYWTLSENGSLIQAIAKGTGKCNLHFEDSKVEGYKSGAVAYTCDGTKGKVAGLIPFEVTENGELTFMGSTFKQVSKSEYEELMGNK